MDKRTYTMRTFGIDINEQVPKLTDDDRSLLFKIRETQRIANLDIRGRTVKNVNGFVEGNYEIDLEFSKMCCATWE